MAAVRAGVVGFGEGECGNDDADDPSLDLDRGVDETARGREASVSFSQPTQQVRRNGPKRQDRLEPLEGLAVAVRPGAGLLRQLRRGPDFELPALAILRAR